MYMITPWCRMLRASAFKWTSQSSSLSMPFSHVEWMYDLGGYHKIKKLTL